MTRPVLLAAALAAACTPADHRDKPVSVIDPGAALLVAPRDHLAGRIPPDPALGPPEPPAARVRDDLARLALDHPDWSPAGLARAAPSVAIGCPGAASVDRAIDPKGTGGDLLGPGMLA